MYYTSLSLVAFVVVDIVICLVTITIFTCSKKKTTQKIENKNGTETNCWRNVNAHKLSPAHFMCSRASTAKRIQIGRKKKGNLEVGNLFCVYVMQQCIQKAGGSITLFHPLWICIRVVCAACTQFHTPEPANNARIRIWLVSGVRCRRWRRLSRHPRFLVECMENYVHYECASNSRKEKKWICS